MEKPRYSIEKKLKEGGYGSIYLGFDSELNIPIVIKKIHVEGMNPEKQYRIAYDDALIASRLRGHPNIVNVYGFNKTSTDKFVVIMEYINGYNFAELPEIIKQLKLQSPLDFSLYMVSQICEGLEYAHSRMDKEGNYLNIIHRDISPSNIMISFEGFIKIIDFGIAKGRIRKQSQTKEGFVKGKLAYMSPEQIKGLPYDHHVDVYATGVILFELVTGERLFQESDYIPEYNFIQDVANQNIDLQALFERHNIPDNVRSIICKAIAIDPQDRYQSAGDMQSDIISALSNKSEAELRQKISKFLKEIKRASKKIEEKKDSYEALSDTHVSTIEIEGDFSDEEEGKPLQSQELSHMSDIITPSMVPLLQYDKLRFEYNLHRLQEKIDERNRFVISSRRADPVSGLKKIEQWVDHNKLTPFIKLNLDGKEIKLTIVKDKLKQSYKDVIESEKIIKKSLADQEGAAVEIEKDTYPENQVIKQKIVSEKKAGDRVSEDEKKKDPKTKIIEGLPLQKSSKKLYIGIGLLLLLIIIVILGVKFIPGFFNKVIISSYPQGAQVVIDNETYGVTPVAFSPAQETSEVSLKLSGFPDISTELNLKNLIKDDRNIHFVFNKSVKIRANSEQAQIFINNDRIGYSKDILVREWKVDNPIEIQALLEGFDTLDIALEYTEDGTFKILPEETPWLDVEVDPDTKDLSLFFEFGKWVVFATDPRGADIKVMKGNNLFTDSGRNEWYPIGRYSAAFNKDGYEPADHSFTIGPNFKDPPVIPLRLMAVAIRQEEEIPEEESIVKPRDLRRYITVRILSGNDEPISGMEAIAKYDGEDHSLKTNDSGFTIFTLSDANPGDRIELTFNPSKGFSPVSSKRVEIIEGENSYTETLYAHYGGNIEKLDQGKNLIESNKHDDAISTFNEVERGSTPQEFSEYLDAQYYIAYIHQLDEDWDEAINQYSQVVELKTNHALAYYNLAMCHFGKGDYRNSSENFNNVLTYERAIPILRRESICIKSRYYDALGRTIFIRENLSQMSQELKALRIRETILKWNDFLDFPPKENEANIQEFGKLKQEADELINSLKSL